MINDYWMYNSLTPWDPDITSRDPQEAPVWDVSKDPCRQVPGGWRLPTSSEFLLLGGREFTEERDRLQSPNWDNDANVTVIGKGPYLDVKDNSYTSFRGDDGQWVTFFKTASLDPRSYNNRLDYERWVLRLADSGMFMVSDGGRGISYTSIQIDGEQDYCKTNSRARDRMISIRCVKDIVP